MIFTQIGNLIGRRYETRSGLDAGSFGIRCSWSASRSSSRSPSRCSTGPPLGAALGTGPVAPWLAGLAALGAPVLFLADWGRKRFQPSWLAPAQ